MSSKAHCDTFGKSSKNKKNFLVFAMLVTFTKYTFQIYRSESVLVFYCIKIVLARESKQCERFILSLKQWPSAVASSQTKFYIPTLCCF